MTSWRPPNLPNLLENNSGDYTYRLREPWDLGFNTLRNPTLDQALIRVNGAINDMFIRELYRAANKPDSPGSFPEKKVNSLGITEINPLPKAKDSDLWIRIYLWGENSSDSGEPFITIPLTPTEVDYQPTSNLKALDIMGSDLQPYHYGGGEDSLTFEVSWMGLKNKTDESPMDKAMKIVSLSKGSGWARSVPPIVYLGWGSASKAPFKDMLFIVERAPFKPRQFTRYATVQGPSPFATAQENNHFHPMYVQQTINLKRVR